MNVCAHCGAPLLLALAVLLATAGAQLQPDAGYAEDGAVQDQGQQRQQQDQLSPLGDVQPHNAGGARDQAQRQADAVGNAAPPAGQIEDGTGGDASAGGQVARADSQPLDNGWDPAIGSDVPYGQQPVPMEPTGDSPQYEQPVFFPLPDSAGRAFPAPLPDDARPGEAFQAWYAAQEQLRRKHAQQRPSMPLPYVFSYYPYFASNAAAGYAPYILGATRRASHAAPKDSNLQSTNSDGKVVAGWPKDAYVRFPSPLVQADHGSAEAQISSFGNNALGLESNSAAGANRSARHSSLHSHNGNKPDHSDSSLSHYNKSSSKPHHSEILRYPAPGSVIAGIPGNFVLSDLIPGHAAANGVAYATNISGNNLFPGYIAPGSGAPGGPFPAFLLPPKKVIHAGKNLTLFYFELNKNMTSKSNAASLVRSKVDNPASNDHAEDHQAHDDRSTADGQGEASDHEAGHHEAEDHEANEHASTDNDHHDAEDKTQSRAQRSANDRSFLTKLSEWACLGRRTANGEAVYCDSIFGYARILAVLVGVTVVVTFGFVLLIHGWARKKKPADDEAADREERAPLTAENDDDQIECDFRDDSAKRLFVQILKRDMKRDRCGS